MSEFFSSKTLLALKMGGAAAAALGAYYLFFTEDQAGQTPADKSIEYLITEKDSKDLTIPALRAQMNNMENQLRVLTQKIDANQRRQIQDKQTEDHQEKTARQDDILMLEAKIQTLESTLQSVNDELKDKTPRQQSGIPSSTSQRPAGRMNTQNYTGRRDVPVTTQKPVTFNPKKPADFYRRAPLPNTIQSSQYRFGSTDGDGGKAKPVTIRFGSSKSEPAVVAQKKKAPQKTELIPAGTMLSGRLLTGLDAPTGETAKSNPVPILIEVEMEAILPNQFTADLESCFIVAGAYGDLSSQRAYVRTEKLSCIRDDGGVIETKVHAYAAGADGKAGLRGRLVSKQGSMLANSMIAGFAEGVVEVFNTAPIPSFNLDPGDSVDFQSLLSASTAQAGAVKGATSALDRLAQYYLDMAEKTYPILEVDANRYVDIVLLHGVKLAI